MPSDWEQHGKAFRIQRENDAPEQRYPTGLGALDEILAGGLHEGQFIVAAACPGGAKSAFAECVTLHASQAVPVLFVPLEMGTKRSRHRMAAKLHKSSLDDFCKYLESSDVRWRASAENALRALDARNIGILSPQKDAEAMVDYMFSEAVRYGAKILIIDHAREITGWMDESGAPAKQARIVKKIRDLAAEHRIATVLLQQIEKKHDGKRPTSSIIQDTSTLSQKADVVLLFHLPFKKDKVRNNVIEILVDKNRNGPEGLLHMHWTPHTMTMHGMTQSEAQNAMCCRRGKYDEEGDER